MSRDPRIGSTVGPYRIERVLGRGGMGVVYLALDSRLDRRIALKILAADLSSDATFAERFKREARMAAATDHPNIIPIYEAGEADGDLYLAMRYVDGPSLEELLEQDHVVAPAQLVPILSQVAAALDAAHARDLVHRDVKPGNVMITTGGSGRGRGHVYLTDFGLTRRTAGQTRLTAAGSFIGTIAYVAPEQIRGDDVDGRADQYSLGCMAFECLTGGPPFPRPTDVASLFAHVSDPPPSASAARPGLPPAVDPVIAQAMAKRPGDRYPDCEAFVAALAEALRPPGSATIAIAAPPGPVGSGERTAPATGTPVVPGAAGSGGGTGAPGAPAPPAPIPLSPPARPGPPAGPGGGSGRPPWRRIAMVAAAVVVLAGAGTAVALLLSGGGKDGGGSGGTPTSAPAGCVLPVVQSFAASAEDIYVMRADGSGQERVVRGAGGPAWFSDCRRLAFAAGAGGTAQVFVSNVDGSDRHAITSGGEENTQVDVSPDGTRIAFAGIAADGTRDLFVQGVDGRGKRRLSTDLGPDQPAQDQFPSWSPDGTRIAFASDRDGEPGIWVIEADGRTPPTRVVGGPGTATEPAWSPDGTRIVYSSTVGAAEGPRQIFVVDVESGDVTQITNVGSDCVQPDWLDDDTIVYAGNRNGNYDIVKTAADGSGTPSALTTDPVDEKKPAVSPDGRLIAYSAGTGLAR